MSLDPQKVAELEKKITPVNTEGEPVPEFLYKRAKVEKIDGTDEIVFTRTRSKSIVVPASKIDAVVDAVCNGTEEEWIWRDIHPVAKRPGKTTGSDFYLLIFLCVDKLILPPPPEEPVDTTATVDEDIAKRAEEWEKQG